jgi:hypothetical protein
LFLDLALQLSTPQFVREALGDLSFEALFFVTNAARPGEPSPRVAFEAKRDLPVGTFAFGALLALLGSFLASLVARSCLLGGAALRLLAPTATGGEDD